MQKVIEFFKAKSLTDTSMAMTYRMCMENIGQEEECILAVLEAMYDTNRRLADEVLKLRKLQPKVITSL